MEHFYQDKKFEENWFDYASLYKNVIANAKNKSRFVEVGSWKGKSVAFMCVEIANSNKEIDFYCVDTWEGSIEHTEEQKGDNLYKTFLENTKPVEEYYIPIKLSSLGASKKFKDNTLDFVFIDASHEYKDVKNDILAWLPKVKNGGILAGHDYTYFPEVKKAVDETLGESNIIKQESCFVYYKNKLTDFPKINCISIRESEDRRNNLAKQLKEHNFSQEKLNFYIFDRYKPGDSIFIGSKIDSLSEGGRGPLSSHLKAIKYWLENTDEDEAFFCEDDLGLETVKYWNFNWDQFYEKIPKDFGIVQLVMVRESPYFLAFGNQFRNRCFCDWSAAGYLIKRKFAEKIISNYYPNEIFTLEYCGSDKKARNAGFLIPTIETILFTDFGKEKEGVYCFPLFCEDILNCKTTNKIDFKENVNNSPPNTYSYL